MYTIYGFYKFKKIKFLKKYQFLFQKEISNNKLSNVLIVSDKNSEKNFLRSAQNIKNIKVINEEGANIYDMLKFTNVIITSSSMKKMETRLLNEKN